MFDRKISIADIDGEGDLITVSGKGRADSSVTVTFGGKTETVTVGQDGAWLVDFTDDRPADGASVALTVRATSADGSLTSRVLTRSVTIDTVAPEAPAITTIAGDGTVNLEESGGDVSISGTGEVGAEVAVSLGETALGSATVDGEGRWEITVAGATLTAEGAGTTITATATATDAVGNTGAAGSATFEVDLEAPAEPVIAQIATDGAVNAAEATAGVAVTGTAEAGAAVAVTIGEVIRTGQADGEGDWTVTFESGTLEEGADQTVSAVATDAAGNAGEAGEQTLTVDTTTPEVAIPGPIAEDDRINAAEADTGLTVTGTAEPGATVSVTIGGTTKPASLNGNDWTVTFASGELPGEGTQAITVTATDAAGNEAVATREVTLDTTLPNAPTITTIAGDAATGTAYVNGAEATGGFTVTGTAPGEVGATVDVVIGTGETAVTAEGNVDENGNWTVTFANSDTVGLADAEGVAVTAHVTDIAGNESAGTAGYSVIIDTVAPTAPVLNTVSGDDTIASDELGTDLTLGGTAEANAAIAVTFGTTTTSTTADSDGVWTVTIDADDLPAGPTATLTVTATDAAGNNSAVASREITVESPPPVATVTVNGGADLDVFLAATVLGTGPVGTPGEGGVTITSQNGLLAADLIGTGLEWDENTDPTAGTLTGLDFRDLSDGGNVTVLSIRGLEIPATAFANAINGETPAASLDALLSAYAVDLTALDGINDFGGSDHADTLRGGAGEDYIYASLGSDTIDGGADFDQVTYEEIEGTGIVATAGETAGDWTVTAAGEDGFTDRLIGIEALRGTLQADTLTGGSGNDVFRPLGGSDRVDGGDGFDQARYDRDDRFDGGTGAITADFTTGGVVDGFTYDGTVTDGFGDTDYLVNIEHVRGTAGNDTMRAGDTGLHFRGEGGDDSLVGGAGTDTLDGGAGVDEILGGDGADLLFGGDGGDDLYASAGDDTIHGGRPDGVDTAVDQVHYQGLGLTAGITATLDVANGTGTVTANDGNPISFTHSLHGIEILRATQGADSLTGGDGNEHFLGLGGSDTIIGGAGFDLARYDRDYRYQDTGGTTGDAGITASFTAPVTEGGVTYDGTVVDGFGSTDYLSGIEFIRGTETDDAMTAGTAAMMFAGQGGDDTLTGGAEADTLIGGGGNDSLTGGLGADVFDISEGGVDVIADFSAEQGDVLAGVSAQDLATALQGATTVDGGAVLSFGENGSVTFLGHDVASLQQALAGDPLLADVNAATTVAQMSTALTALDADGFGSLTADQQAAVAADVLANRPGGIAIGVSASVDAIVGSPGLGFSFAPSDLISTTFALPLPIGNFGDDELAEATQPAFLFRQNDTSLVTNVQIGSQTYSSEGTNVAFSIEYLTPEILQDELGPDLYATAVSSGGILEQFTAGHYALLELIAFKSTGDLDPDTGDAIDTDGTEIVVTLVSATADSIADFLSGMPADVAVLVKGGTLVNDEWDGYFVSLAGGEDVSIAWTGNGYASLGNVSTAIDAYTSANAALDAVVAATASGSLTVNLLADLDMALGALPAGAIIGGVTLPAIALESLHDVVGPENAEFVGPVLTALNEAQTDNAIALFQTLVTAVDEVRNPPPVQVDLTVNGIVSLQELFERTLFEEGVDVLSEDGTELTVTSEDGSVSLALTIDVPQTDTETGDLIGGTVTTLRFSVDGTDVAQVSGLAIPVDDLGTALEADSALGLPYNRPELQALLSGYGFDVTGGEGDDEVDIWPDNGSNDTLTLGGGFDYVVATYGDDTIDGGGDFDQVAYHRLGLSDGITAVLGEAGEEGFAEANNGSFRDVLLNVEALRGTEGDDSLTGNSESNTFRGLEGNDTINGGDGNDQVRYDRDVNQGGMSGVNVNLGTGTATDGFGDTDVLISIERVLGSLFDDTLAGSDGNDTLAGGAGRDTFVLTGGHDVITDFSFVHDEVETELSDDLILAAIESAGETTVNGTPATVLSFDDDRVTFLNYSVDEFQAQAMYWFDAYWEGNDISPDRIVAVGDFDVSLDYLLYRAFGVQPADATDLSISTIDWTEVEVAVPLPADSGYVLRTEISGDVDDTMDIGYEAWFLLDSYGQFVAGLSTGPMTLQEPLLFSVDVLAADAVYVQEINLATDGAPAETTIYEVMLDDLAEVMQTEFGTSAPGLSNILPETGIATLTAGEAADALIIEGGVRAGTLGISESEGPLGDDYLGFILSDLALEDAGETVIQSRLAVETVGDAGRTFEVLLLDGVLAPDSSGAGFDPEILDAVSEIYSDDDPDLITGFMLRVDTTPEEDEAIVVYEFDFLDRSLGLVSPT